MSKPSAPRAGDRLQVKRKPMEFSFWPVQKGTRRYGLQTSLYSKYPFAVIRDAIRLRCPSSSLAEAQAYVSQSEYFLRAAITGPELAAKPLVLYYSFMNLAKALVLTAGVQPSLDHAKHGLSEQLSVGGKELVDAFLDAYPSSAARGLSVFSEFLHAVSGRPWATKSSLQLISIIPQLVVGHRIWAQSTNRQERFMPVKDILLMHCETTKELWLTVQVYAGNLTRHGFTHNGLLSQSGLNGKFREVTPVLDPISREKILRFEQIRPVAYTDRPSDEIQLLVDSFRGALWVAVTTTAPHRQYYLYMVPKAEQPELLPQLVSIYATAYYLGSITRYRPQQFDSLLSKEFGSLIQEFLSSQPSQFLYMMASEFAHREVTQPALV